MKRCCDCSKLKHYSEFGVDKYQVDGYKYCCKRCTSLRGYRQRISGKSEEEKIRYLSILYMNRKKTVGECAEIFECSESHIIQALKYLGCYERINIQWCSHCERFKDKSEFVKDKYNSDGALKSWCRECVKRYRLDPIVKYRAKEKNAEYYLRNKERINKMTQEYYRRTYESRKEYYQRYYLENIDYHRARNAEYRARLYDATASWSDFGKIKSVFSKARILEEQDSIPRDVDHIIPIINDHVCGLHVEYNLQVLTASENRSKSNKFELITSIEQYRKFLEDCDMVSSIWKHIVDNESSGG